MGATLLARAFLSQGFRWPALTNAICGVGHSGPDPTVQSWEKWASAWLHKFTIVYRPPIPGPLPHGRGSEGSANKPLPGQMDDRMILRERAF